MPLFNFYRKYEIPAIGKTGSTESTVDATSSAKPPEDPPAMWRTKEPYSFLRPKASPASDPQLEMWTIKRCDAFDEDDEDDNNSSSS